MVVKSKNREIQYSQHGMLRMHQRGIALSTVELVIRYGKVIHKQGLTFHYIPRAVQKSLSKTEQEAVNNLVVITGSEGSCLVSCYKNEKALIRIRKKTKWLCKPAQAL